MGRVAVGDRVIVAFSGKKRVEATIEGTVQLVSVDTLITKQGECEQVATECAEIRHDDDGETRWYPWSQLRRAV